MPPTKGGEMPKASKESATHTEQVEGYEGHFEQFEGGYTVGFETYTADADLAPLFKGLPDVGNGQIRQAQAQELVGKGGPASGRLPVILVGDLNSDVRTQVKP